MWDIDTLARRIILPNGERFVPNPAQEQLFGIFAPTLILNDRLVGITTGMMCWILARCFHQRTEAMVISHHGHSACRRELHQMADSLEAEIPDMTAGSFLSWQNGSRVVIRSKGEELRGVCPDVVWIDDIPDFNLETIIYNSKLQLVIQSSSEERSYFTERWRNNPHWERMRLTNG